MYKSPIEITFGPMKMVEKQNDEIEKYVYEYMQEIGVNVDREELLKALRYDRDQYEKGYADGKNSIVRCGECKYMLPCGRCTMFADDNIRPSVSDFCSYGERGESE